MTIWVSSILLFVTSGLMAQQAEPAFDLVKADSPVYIYERWVTFPGKPDVQAREVKGDFVVASTIPKILQLLRDEARIGDWQSHLDEFRVYPLTDSTWLEYSLHDIPWPMSDQEHFLRYDLKKIEAGKVYVITFQSLEDSKLAPLNDSYTRLELSGSWHLEQVEPNRVNVSYRIFSTPSSIPRFLTDPIVRSNLMSTIKSLTKLAEEK